MAENIGYATLNVLPSAQGFGRALTSELNTQLPSAGSDAGTKTGSSIVGAFRGLVGPAMLATGAMAIGQFVAGTVSAASDLQQSTGAIEAIFKDQASAVKGFADEAAGSIGLSKTAYSELAAVLGSQLKNGGTALAELAPKTRDLIGVGADLSAMFGGTTKDAVEALSSALKGERDPIERYGVSLKQASIDAKAASLGFEKVGGSFSNEAQQAATLALIMEQTADAHGAAGREAETFAARQQQLSAGFENLKAKIGGAFLPAAADLMGVFADLVNGIEPFLDEVGPVLTQTFATVGPALGQLGGAFAGLLPNLSPIGIAFQALAPMLPQIGALLAQIATVIAGNLTTVTQALTPVIQALTAHLSGALAIALPIIADLFTQLAPALGEAAALIGQLVAAIAPLIGALLDALVPVIQSLMPIVQTVFGFITDIIKVAVDFIGGIIRAFSAALSGDWGSFWQIIGDTLKGAWDGILAAVSAAIDVLVNWFADLLPAIMSTLAGIGEWLIESGSRLVSGLFNGIATFWENVAAWFASLPSTIGGFLAGAGRWLWSAGIDLIGGLVQGLWNAAGAVGEALLGIIGGAVDGFLGFLGIHSPSRLFRGFGENVGEGLALGLGDMEGDVAKSALGLATAASDAVSGMSLPLSADISKAVPHGGLSGSIDRQAEALAALDGRDYDGPPINIHTNDPNLVGEVVADKLRRR
ncbi:phage-related protein [Microbacterium resistens]|uniref:Phage-related protein n=1 Tax=Microbacterium resistens TaxID=156977 RepID=A0ABU1SD11_9MICO|nr:hypothetical protein [Microbacterium resistens]MDR6866797.1 phage-related protein [Microbacterium resistens]